MGRFVGEAELETALADVRERGQTVVLTNGAFDLLHPGHLGYLREAKRLGDVLVVGVNTDDSVTRLKGPGRPLVAEEDRAEMLAALEPVDLVVLFSEQRADDLIRRVRPDLYVKGGDYSPESLPEADTAAELGIDVRLIDYRRGYSTTALVERMRENEGA
ncbi:MAG: D-beta-D-heptose 7-phosphate kinase / D-beta-D-heptose 1-phosphate adenosyltransferase [Chloroflexota bacterium]|jgi:rfaE bifunctional protein nucleotidyltransferase chain/domain|nr:D-beta-D-heptose 7-phosphate kinase / D-beta-D-heptose 1-phosphate adenosyltransferase [Chloroflexota bacterium]